MLGNKETRVHRMSVAEIKMFGWMSGNRLNRHGWRKLKGYDCCQFNQGDGP